jgi:hypothetical protein
MAKVPLKGSERAAVPGARELAPAEATERMEVSVIVRRRGPGALRDVTQGNNGDFRASAGWDACTGLGSPRGEALAGIL